MLVSFAIPIHQNLPLPQLRIMLAHCREPKFNHRRPDFRARIRTLVLLGPRVPRVAGLPPHFHITGNEIHRFVGNHTNIDRIRVLVGWELPE